MVTAGSFQKILNSDTKEVGIKLELSKNEEELVVLKDVVCVDMTK